MIAVFSTFHTIGDKISTHLQNVPPADSVNMGNEPSYLNTLRSKKKKKVH